MQVQRSIRSQLMLLVMAVAIPLIGLILYSTYALALTEASQARVAALSLAQITAVNVEQFLAESETHLVHLAQRPLIQAVDADQCDPFLEEFSALFYYYIDAGVSDASGQQICSSTLPQDAPMPFVGDSSWFQQIRRTKAFTVGAVQVNPNTGRWVSTIAYPILNNDGEFLGVVSTAIDLVRFQTVLDNITLARGATITILDSEGTVLARSLTAQHWIGQNLRGRDIVDTVLAEHEGEIRARGIENEDKLYGFTTVSRANWSVFAGIPTRSAFAPVYQAILRQGLLSLVVILVVSALAGYLRRQIEHPTRALLDVAEGVAQGNLDRRVPVAGPKELAEVAVQFNHMLDVRKQHTDQLERHTHQLETLDRMGRAVASSLDLPVLLKRVLAHADTLLPAEGLSIWTVNGAELTYAASKEPAGQTHRLPLLTTLARQVVEDGRAIYVPDLSEQPALAERFQQQAAIAIRAVQIVPLTLQGVVIGVMQAVYSNPGSLSSDELKLVQAAANWTAIAIGNAQQHEQLRQLANQVITTQEEERKRLAQELHDEAGQALTALKFSLTMLRDDLPNEPEVDSGEGSSFEQRMQAAIDLTDSTMQQLRLLSHGLHPPSLTYFGLDSALKEFCQDFANRTGLPIHYAGTELPSLADTVSISFYRFLQEALTNIAKHAEAKEVYITLSYQGGEISLQVRDDGKGFDLPALLSANHPTGIGLLGMQERFKVLNGTCDIHSTPGQGTCLVARCRIDREAKEQPAIEPAPQ